MQTRFSLSLVSVSAVAALLTACGGGGGGDESTTTVGNTHTTTPTSVTSTLSTTILGTTYAKGSNEQINYDRLNQVRLAGGFGTIAQDTAIDQAALSHSKYVAQNYFTNSTNSTSLYLIDPSTGWMNAHVEKPTWAGFTGILPNDRIVAAGGNQYNYAGEVMAFGSNASCVDDLLNSVFHRSAVLKTSTQFVGFGLHIYGAVSGVDPFTGAAYSYVSNVCTIEYGQKGNGNTAPSGWMGVYPGIAQTNVPVGMPVGEAPDPDPSTPNENKGSPVSIYFSQPIGLVNSFTLIAAGSNTPVPVKLITLKDFPGYLSSTEAHILPKQNLAKGTTYTASFDGALSNGDHVSKTWTFTTITN